MPLRGKNRSEQSITFEAIANASFGTVDVDASNADTVVVGALALGQDTKLAHVSVTAKTVTGSPTIQIVVGGGAPGDVGKTDTPATAGVSVFATPVTASNALVSSYGGTQVFDVDNMDVIYPKGLPLTLRVTTTADDSVAGLNVAFTSTPIDPKPNQPLLHALEPSDF